MNIDRMVREVFDSLEGNHFGTLGQPDIPMWEEPLVGVAAGDDLYFTFLKEHVGDVHWTPAEAFAQLHEGGVAKDLRVLSMVFPQSPVTRQEQAKARTFPADHWVVSRGEWEPLMEEFSSKLVKRLDQEGIRAVSIDLLPNLRLVRTDNLGLASSWSHRHGAFAAGLGTFGLSEGFISEKGKAVRITTTILEADIPVTPRGDRGPYDWCLYYAKGICGSCIRRCPTKAITQRGHDKEKCERYEDDIEVRLWPDHLEKKGQKFGCGICQVKIPCEDKKPL